MIFLQEEIWEFGRIKAISLGEKLKIWGIRIVNDSLQDKIWQLGGTKAMNGGKVQNLGD